MVFKGDGRKIVRAAPRGGEHPHQVPSLSGCGAWSGSWDASGDPAPAPLMGYNWRGWTSPCHRGEMAQNSPKRRQRWGCRARGLRGWEDPAQTLVVPPASRFWGSFEASVAKLSASATTREPERGLAVAGGFSEPGKVQAAAGRSGSDGQERRSLPPGWFLGHPRHGAALQSHRSVPKRCWSSRPPRAVRHMEDGGAGGRNRRRRSRRVSVGRALRCAGSLWSRGRSVLPHRALSRGGGRSCCRGFPALVVLPEPSPCFRPRQRWGLGAGAPGDPSGGVPVPSRRGRGVVWGWFLGHCPARGLFRKRFG